MSGIILPEGFARPGVLPQTSSNPSPRGHSHSGSDHHCGGWAPRGRHGMRVVPSSQHPSRRGRATPSGPAHPGRSTAGTARVSLHRENSMFSPARTDTETRRTPPPQESPGTTLNRRVRHRPDLISATAGKGQFLNSPPNSTRSAETFPDPAAPHHRGGPPARKCRAGKLGARQKRPGQDPASTLARAAARIRAAAAR